MSDSADIKRILVRTPNWVGDAVISVAALRELRRAFPQSHITLVAPAGTAEIFTEADFADEVLVAKRSGLVSVIEEARAWRQRSPDLALLLQNAFSSALTAFLARIPRRFGYATDRRRALLTTALPVPTWKDERHESFYYLNLVTELERLVTGTAPTNLKPQLELTVSDKRKQAARELLKNKGIRGEKPLIVLSPGSINSQAKRWPAERYGALSDMLTASGNEVVLIGSSGEKDVSLEVQKAAGRPLHDLAGVTSVAEVVAIISIADALITNDTGPAHIGAALGTPTIAIFGPTNPLTTYPLSEKSQMVRHPPDCAPCMLRVCPIDHRCMTAITPDEVFERAVEVLNRQTAHVFG